MNPEDEFPEDAVEVPITNEIDLHTFRPNEIGSLLPEYFRECRLRRILEVRVIHGKGTGALREGVRKLLEKSTDVVSWRGGNQTEGSWGATMVTLAPMDES
ncbi:MAG: Smr/MutS family protein [Verrucomicrobiota bacterium]